MVARRDKKGWQTEADLQTKNAFLESGSDGVSKHGRENQKCEAWPDFTSLARLTPHGQQAAPCQKFSVRYGELKALHRNCILWDKTQMRIPQQHRSLTRKYSACKPTNPKGRHLTDVVSARSLSLISLYAMESSKLCTGSASYGTKLKARIPQQHRSLTRKYSACKPTQHRPQL